MLNAFDEFPALSDLVSAIRTRALSAVEVVDATLKRIEAIDPVLNAFLTVAPDQALVDARLVDEAVARGEDPGLLTGVPIAVKDLQETAGIRTTMGSLVYRDFVPSEDCVTVERLRASGALIVGKTNTPAFGLLGETKNLLSDDCRNPWNPDRTAGGSSGGSAAGVASRMVPIATGTDTAGSITAPSALCGIFGLKPTHGRVPNFPAPDDSLLFEDSGPLALRVADAATMLEAISGWDPRDPVALRTKPLDLGEVVAGAFDDAQPLRGKRVGVSPDLGHFPVESEIADTVKATALLLEAAGAGLEEATPETDHPFDVYMPLLVTDVRRGILPLLDHERRDLFPETHAELSSVPPMTAEQYVGALARLWRFRAALAEFFRRYDLLITPATATSAFPVRHPPGVIGGSQVEPSWTTFAPFSVPWNLTGQPIASVPSGFTEEGLPVGLLVIGGHGREEEVVRAACVFERAIEWHKHRPPLLDRLKAGGAPAQ